MMGSDSRPNMGVPPSGSGSRPSDRAADGVSPVPASIPNAKRTVANTICRPFFVYEHDVRPRQIASVIDRLANTPDKFVAMDLITAELMPGAAFHEKQEAMNRLMQRWRRLGLIEFSRGRWSLTRGAWDAMQASAIEARRAETGTGSVGDESAVPQADAQKGSGR